MIKKVLLFLGAAAIATGTVQAQKIAVPKGLKVELVNSSKMTTNVEMMGQNIESGNETTSTSLLELKETNPEGWLFANTLKHMVMHMNAMGNDINFDSDKEDDLNGDMGKAVKGSLNKPQTVQVDKRGKVSSSTVDTSAGGGMNDMMSMANSMIKGQPFPVLLPMPPGRPMKVGDVWTDSSGTAATVKTVTTYTVKSIDGDNVMLDFSGTMAKKGTIEQQGMQIEMDLSGVVKGNSAYEAATGLLKTNNTVVDTKGTVGIMGQSAPMTIKITTTATAKKLQ